MGQEDQLQNKPLKVLIGQTVSRVEFDGKYINIFNELDEKIICAEGASFFDGEDMYFLNEAGDGLAV